MFIVLFIYNIITNRNKKIKVNKVILTLFTFLQITLLTIYKLYVSLLI